MRIPAKPIAFLLGVIALILLPNTVSIATAADITSSNELDTVGWQFSGLIEMGINAGHDFSAMTLSDITVSTVELAAQTRINPWISASLLMLYEEDNTAPPELDAAILTLGNREELPYTVTIGRTYVPFGVYDSNMISDPLTLELGEIRETLVAANYEDGGIFTSAYVFNGNIDRQSSDADSVKQYGLSFSYMFEGPGMLLDTDIAYISNLADSGSISSALPASLTDPPSVQKSIPGASATLTYNHGLWVVIAEYVSALRDFSDTELAYATAAAKPSAYNVELAHIVTWWDKEFTVAIARQGSYQAVALALPEQRTLVSLSTLIYEKLNLRAEWRRDRDYEISTGGTGNHANMLSFQAAVKF